VAAIAGTTRRISRPARAPIAKAVSVQAATAQVEHGGSERALVAVGEERLVIPGQQQAERPGGGRHRDREQHQLGQRPAPPAEALGPGVPEGAGLQFPAQHRRPDERPDQRRRRLQQGRDELRRCAVSVVEVVDQIPAGQ
jgi:hypothetical protein